jgi:hypothetical protein
MDMTSVYYQVGEILDTRWSKRMKAEAINDCVYEYCAEFANLWYEKDQREQAEIRHEIEAMEAYNPHRAAVEIRVGGNFF